MTALQLAPSKEADAHRGPTPVLLLSARDLAALALPPAGLALLRAPDGRTAAVAVAASPHLRPGKASVRRDVIRAVGKAAVAEPLPAAAPVRDAARLRVRARAPPPASADAGVVAQRVRAALLLAPVASVFSTLVHGVPVVFDVVSPPDGPEVVRVVAGTSIAVEAEAEQDDPPEQHTQSLGGLDRERQAVIHELQPALREPEFFAERGIQPVRGVLLHGPPGTGKTSLCREVGAALGVAVFSIDGPELVSGVVGESERRVRDVFARAAAAAPALVVIDEVDAVCPRREAARSELEARLVTTLLTLLDGLESAARVCVLAATNRPDALDAAVRRPGRFDREVEVGVPGAAARADILRALGVAPAAADSIGAVAHGFVGADLRALVEEARLLGDGGGDGEPELRLALRRVRPSALREVAVEVPRVAWDDVGGQEDVKQALREAVEWPLQRADDFARMGVSPPSGVLLYGPPGCSKTLLARAMATASGMNFLAVKGPELLSKWVGESERAMQRLFRRARAAAPSIVFFDEIDAIAARRGGEGGSRVGDRVLSQLLTELDGVQARAQVVVVAATNRPDAIDPALLRPGRLDRLLYVGLPDEAARRAIAAIHTRAIPVDCPVGDFAAARLGGYTGAEIAAVCQEAALCALARDRAAAVVAAEDFEAAVQRVRPQVTAEVLEFYRSFGAGRSA